MHEPPPVANETLANPKIFSSNLHVMNKLVAELIGTFFLMFAIGHAVLSGSALAPIAIGVSLMVMVYSCGHISGAHFNPAITVALWLRGKCASKDIIPYMACQIVGSVLAALAVVLFRGKGTPDPAAFETAPLVGAELLGTFALAWVILNVATAKGTENNSFYGAAIGMTVTAGIFAVGDISGAVFNPAVAVGAVAMGLIHVKFLWLYLVICPIAGVIATKVFLAIKAGD